MCCDKPVAIAGPMLAVLVLALPAAALEVVGEPELVFAGGQGVCEADMIPDAPARAFRSADGGVRLIAAHHRNRLFAGPDLDHLAPDCRIAYRGAENSEPAALDDHAWIAATYTLDGTRVFALVHDEFHGHRRPDLCPAAKYMACWNNRVTGAVSDDGGRSFRRTGFVAAPPYRYDGHLGRHTGYFNPSNIVASDGWYYATVFATEWGAQKPGNCLMRTRDLADPRSWRGWDGMDFSVRFVDAYHDTVPAEAHVCAPLPNLKSPISSIVRHGDGWVATLAGGDGFYASRSRDLLGWTAPKRFWEVTITGRQNCGTPWATNYPSLLDPASSSRNLESVGTEAWLYYTRFWTKDCGLSMKRDLMRVRVRL